MVDASAIGRRSRNRGATFERRIATDLRNWLGDEWDVRRTRTSDQRNREHGGEFAIVGPFRFPWAIECKSDKRFDLAQLWKDPVPSPIASTNKSIGWWGQARVQAEGCNRLPLLVVKPPGQAKVLAILRRETARKLEVQNSYPSMRFELDTDTLDREDLVAVRWDALLQVDPCMLMGLGR